MGKKDNYASHTDEELARLPTVYREGLLEGQVVLVSGAAGGIGRAICMLCGRLGASIVACGRDGKKLVALQEALDAQGISCFSQPMTIRDPELVAKLMDAVWERHGRLDVLVNNAGGQFAAPALDITPKGWHAVVETNLYGTWYMMQEAAKRWSAKEQPGCIVNIATITGRATPGIPHTAASRAGAINLSISLSVEWAPYNIRVNCIAVGIIASPGLANYPESARPSFEHNPMRRTGDVHDIAQACVYLAAPSGAFITGEVLNVTGGGHIWGDYWPLGKPEYFNVDD
ncbi:MAG: SDR family oxidoreductase [SAR324 cluster bacterium]|nr:SDR family oxidoreductase [SAR324 cluster bacterium]MCZ6534082.1 SDR family oxidoreductase [SAR324 cluster bacterium]MCZ6730876.1 SDR family oxidoreductase [SAR324 cluster bacterium]